MTFREAVEATPSVQSHYRAGLEALPDGDAARIRCGAPRRLTGSINLDAALRQQQPNAPRWDFGIGYRRKGTEVGIWVEVHPASSTSIATMLAKLAWLKGWLKAQAPYLWKLTQGDYHWISTDARIAITPNSRQAKRLAAVGLRGPARVLRLA
jgi:hypothetical protein